MIKDFLDDEYEKENIKLSSEFRKFGASITSMLSYWRYQLIESSFQLNRRRHSLQSECEGSEDPMEIFND